MADRTPIAAVDPAPLIAGDVGSLRANGLRDGDWLLLLGERR